MVDIELLALFNEEETPTQEESLYLKCQDILDLGSLQKTNVQVVGLGATGSIIVELLSRYGIPMVGYDFDVVNTHNSHNQIYWLDHKDMCKGDALAAHLKAVRNYNFAHENIAIRMSNVEDYLDLESPIVLAIDSVDSVREILTYLKNKKFKYVIYPGLPNNITELALAVGTVRVITPENIEQAIKDLGDTTDEQEEAQLLEEIKGCAAQQYALLVFDVAVQAAKLIVSFWYCSENKLPVKFYSQYFISAIRPYVYQ